MSHVTKIIDDDKYFVIDPQTRGVSQLNNEEVRIVQRDHNSERITFYFDRYVDGHDLTECNNIEVHYNNISADGKQESLGRYEVGDIKVDPADNKKCFCTWLLSQTCTKYVGYLAFSIHFLCVTDDVVDYGWGTASCDSIKIVKSIYNDVEMTEEYVDALASWKVKVEEELKAMIEESSSGSNGSSGEAVLYTEQTLNDTQKAQARANIGAIKSWNDMEDRPFYDKREVIYSGTDLTPELQDGQYSMLLSDMTLTLGESYYIVIDGVGTKAVCAVYMNVNFIGNIALLGVEGVEDTGESFVVLAAGGEANVLCAKPFTTLEISKAQPQKIPSEYLYNADFAQVDKAKGGYIKNKPFGIEVAEWILKDSQFAIEKTNAPGFGIVGTTFVSGEKYLLIVNGEEYISEAFDSSGIGVVRVVSLDESYELTISTQDNGSGTIVLFVTATVVGTYEISVGRITEKLLDEKYLPDTVPIRKVFYGNGGDLTFIYKDETCSVKATKAEVKESILNGGFMIYIMYEGEFQGITTVSHATFTKDYAEVYITYNISDATLTAKSIKSGEYTGS